MPLDNRDAENEISMPMRGIVLCCTSVPELKRTEIEQHAHKLGAVYEANLTDIVTHLIVGGCDTPKYEHVAKERPDVQPMTVEWWNTIRRLWMEYEDIDMEELGRTHRLPTFSFFKFSMTGCDEPNERQNIADLIRENGGIYDGDLTKQITHLISFKTEGAKYKAAQLWGLRIVSVEWIRDSVERGMILDESLYHPTMPAEERGRGAWDRTRLSRSTLGKRSRSDGHVVVEEKRRKLRRTASNKLTNANEQLWGDIVGSRPTIQVAQSGVWDDASQLAGEKKSMELPKVGVVPSAARVPGMFDDCLFHFHEFHVAKAEILSNHLLPLDAKITHDLQDLMLPSAHDIPSQRYLIVPHDMPIEVLPSVSESPCPVTIVTPWWVERCLHNRRFLPPSEHVIGRPFPVFPIEGFSKMTVSSSGFSGIDLLHVKKAVELVGATYSEDMTPQSSLLVTHSVAKLRKDKREHARRWDVPIVEAAWLWDTIAKGNRLSLAVYLVGGESGGRAGPDRRASSDQTQPADLPPTLRAPRASGSSSDVWAPTKAEGPNVWESTKSEASSGKTTRSGASDGRATRSEPSSKGRTTRSETPSYVPTKSETSYDVQLTKSETPSAERATEADVRKAAPLQEIDPNSPAKTSVSHPPSGTVPDEKMSKAISSLLAKTKSGSGRTLPTGPTETRKRGPNRILGRATSNVSTGSAGFSRATSVDSTATYHAGEHQMRSGEEATGSGDDPSLNHLIHGDRVREAENPGPPPTQLQYKDAASEKVQAEVMAKLRGVRTRPPPSPTAEVLYEPALVEQVGRREGVRRSARDRVRH